MNWSYGITTVPERMQTTLPRTIKSLANAGFDKPRLFIDGWYGEPSFMGLPVTTRDTPIKLVGNWMASMWELYTRDATAHRFAMFQDDVIAVSNLRSYLERCPYPELGYLNLYTFPENTLKDHKEGWHLSNQRGMGALGLVFNRHAMQHLFQAGHLARKPLEANKIASWKRLDGGVVSGLKQFKIQEYVHYPSLVQHIGTETSILGNLPGGKPYQGVASFPGESQDAMGYLSSTPQPVEVEIDEDPISKAVSIIGEQRERITEWMNEGCTNCEEAQRKRAKIGAWASRVLKGKTEDAVAFLERILED